MKIIKLGAPWCTHCTVMTKTMKSMDIQIPIEEINIDTNKDIAMQYGVRSIPALIMVDDNGVEIRRLVGGQNKERISEFIG